MLTFEQRKSLGEKALGKSVIKINPTMLQEAKSKEKEAVCFGVKNTDGIPHRLINKLRNDSGYLFHTIDKMADLGRSIDIDLINPITYRCMTGSSSGGCVNIIKGINQVAIGTDGGGSVLAPALSTNIHSFLGKGIGLVTEGSGNLSTDGISFQGGIGVIANSFSLLKKTVNIISSDPITSSSSDLIKIVVPQKNNLILPDGTDARTYIDKMLARLTLKTEVTELAFKNPYERAPTVSEVLNIFEKNMADVILSYEGAIDLYAYDETIPKMFFSKASDHITNPVSKAFIKSANMCGASAITIPDCNIASGFVLLCRPGIDAATKLFDLAEEIDSNIVLPEVFRRYFTDIEKFVNDSTYI